MQRPRAWLVGGVVIVAVVAVFVTWGPQPNCPNFEWLKLGAQTSGGFIALLIAVHGYFDRNRKSVLVIDPIEVGPGSLFSVPYLWVDDSLVPCTRVLLSIGADRKRAERVEVVVVDVCTLKGDGVHEKVKDWIMAPLTWTVDDASEVAAINPQSRWQCNLFRMYEPQQMSKVDRLIWNKHLIDPTMWIDIAKSARSASHNFVLTRGSYAIHLRASAQNANPLDRVLVISFHDYCQTDLIREKRALVVHGIFQSLKEALEFANQQNIGAA